MTETLKRVEIYVSDDGKTWKPAEIAGDAWHCACGVGVLTVETKKCPNCFAAVKVVGG